MSDKDKQEKGQVRMTSLGSFKKEIDLTNKIQEVFAGKSPFFYCESVGSCVLEKRSPEAISIPPDYSFEGHVFDETIDVRWVRISASEWRAWKTAEGSGDEVTKLERRYYLNGEWEDFKNGNKDIGIFTEGRFPGKEFEYPVVNMQPGKQDRSYIEVVEYRRVKPGAWGNSSEEINMQFNRPLLCGYRFKTVGVGRE